MMNTHDTLVAFSEWLDSEGLIVSDGMGKPLSTFGAVDHSTPPDKRSHDELATEFMEQWEGSPLAGTPHATYADKISGKRLD